MASSSVLREYLIALGYKVDEVSYKKFIDGMARASKGAAELGAEVVATAGTIGYAVEKVARQYEDLYYASQRTGSSVAALRAYGFASRQIGIDVTAARGAVEGFAQAVRLSPGLAGLLRGLGIDPADSQKAALAFTKQMKSRFGDKGYFAANLFAGMFNIPEDVFFQLWHNMDTLEKQQSDFTKRQREAGLGGKETAENFLSFSRAINTLESDLGLLADRIAVDFLQPAQKVVEAIDEIIQAINRLDVKTGGASTSAGTLATTGLAAYLTKRLLYRLLGWGKAAGGAAAEGAGAAAGRAGGAVGGLALRAILGPLGFLLGMTEEANKGEDWRNPGRPTLDTNPPRATPGLGNVTRMNAELVERLRAMRAAMPEDMGGFTVRSGWRSREEQVELYRTKPPGMAAPPGSSKHERGEAADLRYSNAEVRAWVQAHAKEFGLQFPVPGEPWHVEGTQGIPRTDLTSQGGASSGVVLHQNTEINVNGGGSVAATAGMVLREQESVNSRIVRDLGGIVQ